MMIGILTAALLAMYLGIVAWAYSSRRRSDFAAAAQLPLTEGFIDTPTEPHA